MNPDAAVVSATILADLPQRLYRLETEDGTQLIAGLSPRIQRLGKTFKPGDHVRVRPAGHDDSRGTILGLTVEPLSPTASGSGEPLDTPAESANEKPPHS